MLTDDFARYSAQGSALHRCDARWKILAALAFIAVVVSLPTWWWPAYGALAVVALGAYAVARLSWHFLLGRLLLALPFLVLVAAGIPLARGWEQGREPAAALLARSLLALAVAITLMATTPFDQLTEALTRLRVPPIFTAVLAFMYRYHFVLAEELSRMRRAQAARTFRRGYWREFTVVGSFAGVLFVRAFERAERVYAAMCARGWSGGARKRR